MLLSELTYDEYRKLLSDKKKKEKLIYNNLSLVGTILSKYSSAFYSDSIRDEAYQAGIIKLIRSIELYNPEKGYEFSTYAWCGIEREISKYLFSQSNTVYLPKDIQNKRLKIIAVNYRLQKNTGIVPTFEEVAAYCKTTEDIVSIVLDAERRIAIPLDIAIVTELFDKKEDYHEFDEIIDRISNIDYIKKDILPILTDVEKLVIAYRYGLIDGLSRTHKEVGKIIHKSHEHSRTVERSALNKIRKHLKIA